MINVFGIAGNLIAPVNPPIKAVLKISNGYTVDENYKTIPKHISIDLMIEVQALSSSDLKHIENINQQSDMRAVYILGGIKGLNRPLQYGGDKIEFYGSDWLVTQVLEEWGEGNWSKIAVTRQISQPQNS